MDRLDSCSDQRIRTASLRVTAASSMVPKRPGQNLPYLGDVAPEKQAT